MRRWECIDFELEIREGGPREYPVAVRSPAGEAREGMRLPFDEREIEDRLRSLEIALLRSGGSRRRMPSQEEQTVQEFGRALFEALLVGEVRTHYERSLDKARQQNKGLRLKLRIQPPELSGLPWEFLYDEGQGEYLCLSSETPLVRYVDLHRPVEQLPVTPPLRILGMVSSPRDLDPLNVEDEKRLVEEAVKDLSADGLVELTWLEGQTWRDLHRAMRRGSWHIFHFIGHGDFDPTSDEGRVAFSDESGRGHLLKATLLGRLLDDHRPLRLVFLNSCEGAQGSEGDPFSSTAATLVRRGVPAVVAMQYEISDKAAIEFSRSFYDAVADGLPVDAAVTEARTAVSMTSNLEWGTPVLYMRSPDGHIFDISTKARPVEPIQEEARDRDEEERQNRLDELYTQARRSHRDRQWQAVLDIFDQIHTLDPDYPDPEGLLVSAREELAALEHERTMTALYGQGQRHVEAGEWERALECFEEVQRLEPGYRKTGRLLSRVRDELAKPPTVEVPDLSGQDASQASSTLAKRCLTIGDREEVPSETVPEGEMIGQSPEAGTEVEADSSVSVTVSTGPSSVEVPNLTGKNAYQASSTLAEAGLKLGDQDEAPSGDVPDGDIVGQEPVAGTKAERGSLVSITISSEPEEKVVTTVPDVWSRSETGRDSSSTSPVIVGSRTEEKQRVGSEGSSSRMARGTTVRSGKRTKLMIGVGLLCAVVAVVLIATLADSSGEETADFTLTSTLGTTGQGGTVVSVAFSSEGSLLASGSGDDTVKLWDPQSGEELRTLSGHSGMVYSVAFSPDGSLLASGSGDGTVKLWDPQSGELLQTLTGDSGIVYSVAFSPEGSLLASGGDDGTVKLWDPRSGELLQTLEGFFPVAFSPEGSLLASGDGGGSVKLWDSRSGELLQTLTGDSDIVYSVAFSPEGSLLASGGDDGTVKLWDPRSGELLQTLTGHSGIVSSVAFSPDGSVLASSDDDSTVKLWDPRSGELLQTLTDAGIPVAFSPERSLLASGSVDGIIEIWETGLTITATSTGLPR